MSRFVLLFAFVLLGASESWAFHLGDHEAVTESAVAQIKHCLGVEIPSVVLITADLSEDLNLVRKWMKYSHYYNPYKTLDMRRADSSATIEQVEDELITRPESSVETWALMGRAVHHIQDAAVPSHVVPINHGFGDGFESYSAKLADDESCDWIATDRASDENLMTILRDTAIQTLTTLKNSVPFLEKSEGDSFQPFSISWQSAYWTPSNDRSFGSYGLLGNTFGTTEIVQRQARYLIPDDIFRNFKAEQMDLARTATRRAILWFLERRETIR